MTTTGFPAVHEFGYWWHRYRRTWRGTAVISIANPLLFVTALGFGLGRLVDERNSAYLHGGSYLAFIGPGLLAASAMQMGFIHGSGPVFQSARIGGNYRAAVTTPMEPSDIFTGHLLFTAFRATLDSAAILLVLLVFRAASPAALPGAVLTALGFATPISAYAVSTDRPAKLSALFRFVIMPLYVFSGTFFPAEQLPGPLRTLVWISPLWHGTELCRGSGPIVVHVLVLLALIVIGYPAGRRAYTRRLTA
ncbi:ABC transporter permease [Actinoplanes sp. NPDC020271]|uniref:ABC transporter permease n=1 Tax=Actinoplanes sp. NPDC020271 TaxID=3363896 RepID=UPI00379EDD60